jgi:hypothetical protein
LQGFEERVTRLETDIRDSGKRAVELEAKVGASFEKEERYHHLVKRQSEIEDQLDLTKNQAPSQMDDITPESIERTVSTKIGTHPKHERPKKVGIRVSII